MDSKILKTSIYYLSIFFTGLIYILFASWFIKNESSDLLPTIFTLFTIIMITILIQEGVQSLYRVWFLNDDESLIRSHVPDMPDGRTILFICIGLLIWVAMLNILIILVVKLKNPNAPFISAYENHYKYYLNSAEFVRVAETGYEKLKNPEIYRGIYPLYPWLIKILGIFGNKYVMGIFINNILAIISGVLIFMIGLYDYDYQDSLKSIIFYTLFPVSFFTILPINIGLYLTLTLLYVYLVRRRMWGLSFIAGFFVGISDPHALILVVFAFVEFISMIIEETTEKRLYGKIRLDVTPMDVLNEPIKEQNYGRFGIDGLMIFSIPIAGVFYLWINRKYLISGGNIILHLNSFIESEKRYFFNNAFELFSTLLNKGRGFNLSTLRIYLPIIICIVLVLLMLSFGSKRIRGSYLVYSIIMFISIYGSSDILKSNKYVVLIFPLYFIFGNASSELATNILIFIISFSLFIFCFSNFIMGIPVF